MLGISGLAALNPMAPRLMGLDCLAIFGGIGWQEIVIIVIIVLILFGGRKIPELARGIGRGMREFKREMRGVKQDLEEAMNEDEDEAPRPRPKKKRRPRPAAEEQDDSNGDDDKTA